MGKQERGGCPCIKEANNTQLDMPRKNLICNFRAPSTEKYQLWQDYKKWALEHGHDICNLTLSLIEGFMKGTSTATAPNQIINISMANTFQYQVAKPRRVPFNSKCVKPQFQNTVSSSVWEAYVLHKARHLKEGFCFRDYLEMEYDSFRRIVVRLKRKGEIMAIPVRTYPQIYILTEFLEVHKK